MKEDSKADHDFDDSGVKIIWAYGRDDDDFYSQDELKYHGGNRGVVAIGEWRLDSGAFDFQIFFGVESRLY